jgi:hypothetical protein
MKPQHEFFSNELITGGGIVIIRMPHEYCLSQDILGGSPDDISVIFHIGFPQFVNEFPFLWHYSGWKEPGGFVLSINLVNRVINDSKNNLSNINRIHITQVIISDSVGGHDIQPINFTFTYETNQSKGYFYIAPDKYYEQNHCIEKSGIIHTFIFIGTIIFSDGSVKPIKITEKYTTMQKTFLVGTNWQLYACP